MGLYLCGPTVYNDAHLGNARGPIVFDVLTRYLRYLGYHGALRAQHHRRGPPRKRRRRGRGQAGQSRPRSASWSPCR
ncbi:MAG: hypothetical protein WKG07_03510 [Hymenobacter sp.]